MNQNSGLEIGASLFDFAAILTATTAAIPVPKPLAIPTAFSYFIGVDSIRF